MAHPLEQKVAQVRKRARRLLVLYALGWTLACVLGIVLLLTALDYAIRFQDHGLRLINTLAVGLVAVWCGYRFWFGALRRPMDDVRVAQRIERRFPALTDGLSSAVQFLRQSEFDKTAGSATLRRALILETSARLEDVDLAQVFEPRPTRRALAAGALAALVTIGLILAAPSGARIALRRLALPFGSDAWPRFYSVAFRNTPQRLAAGQTFEVELLNDARHRVPELVKIHYRYETGPASFEEESEPMQSLAGAVVARKEHVTRPFWYRAEGGDDASMDWVRLEVLEPPRLASMQVQLYFPEYSGLPVASSDRGIQALRGTRVEITGASTKPLQSATICQEGGSRWPAELSSGSYAFTLRADASEPLIVERSGPYWIEMQDAAGLVGGTSDRWELRAIDDAPPSVAIEQPGTNVFVTARGGVPLAIAVKDDLAIHDISLHFARSDRSDVEDFSVPLYVGPDSAPRPTAAAPLAAGRTGESRRLEHRWQLADLGLSSGAQVTFWAAASDYLPQTGKSAVRRLTIITPAELEERLAQRQTLIFGELQRVLKLEQDARGQTSSLEIQLDHLGHLDKQDIDRAQSAELNQRQVKRTLTSRSEGIPAHIAEFLAEAANNRVDNSETQRQMAEIVEELDRLGEEHLATIERELTSVIKAALARVEPAPAKADPDPLMISALASTVENQDQVIGSLEKILGELNQWDTYRRFARDIAALERDQAEVAGATAEIGAKTLGREAKDLAPQHQVDLKRLAAQQTELARRLEKAQQQMAEMNRSLKSTDPLSAATIADGLVHAERQGTSGRMRQTGEQLEKNQLGQATQQQAAIAKDLRDLAAILSNRREQELTQLVKQLRESEQELTRIRKQEAGLRKQMHAAAANENAAERRRQLQRLAREQKSLEEEASRLARRLQRLQAEQAGRSAAGAAGRMDKSGAAGEQGDGATAEQQADKAQRDLEEAQQQLAQRRRQAEEDLARQQMAKMEDSLKSFRERQQKLLDESARLETLRAAAGRLTRAQLSTVNDLARQQKSLQGETSLLAERLAATEVIHLALEGAAAQMTRAGDLLERRETGAETQAAQEAARERFSQLLSAFESKPKPAGEQQDNGGAGSGGGGGQSDAGMTLAQLKLLKILQEDVNSRFRSLSGEVERAANAPGDRLAELAAEQGKLADLALKLSEPPEANIEDDPDKLPDVRSDTPATRAPVDEPLPLPDKEPD